MKSRTEKKETNEIQLYVRSTEGQELKLLGKLKKEHLKSLTTHVGEEFLEDKGYYINRDTLVFLKEQGVDNELIQLLEKALEGLEPDDGVDIVCPKMTKASNDHQRNKVVLQSAFNVVAGIMMILSLALPWEKAVIREFSGFHCGIYGSFPASVLFIFVGIAIIMIISPIMFLIDKQNLFKKVSVAVPIIAVGAWYFARAEMAAPYRSYLELRVGFVMFPYWCLLPLLGSLLSSKKSIEVRTERQSNAIINGLAIGNALSAGLIFLSLFIPWVVIGHSAANMARIEEGIVELVFRGVIPKLLVVILFLPLLLLFSSLFLSRFRNLRAIERISLLAPTVVIGALIGLVFQIVTTYKGAWRIYGPQFGFFIFLCGCLLPLLGAFYPRIFARKTSEVEEIPSEILCPGCGINLELDDKEIEEKMFTCPECKETFRVTDRTPR